MVTRCVSEGCSWNSATTPLAHASGYLQSRGSRISKQRGVSQLHELAMNLRRKKKGNDREQRTTSVKAVTS